ncbi:zinc finger [Stylonychia lemnae]|uniref:Zinc finger n=1 Tax=Stylonychia lemnae TaxID=5949 RepID=A0A077ZP20_STYLE|nr:zinc finger [Stylonychia lemnae]|eukprot:CDW71209.1 zinc finger [Stylonychia lemnae]
MDPGMMGVMMPQAQMVMNHTNQLNNLYKTQLCKHFQQTKQCHVGKRCHFAHGEHELRKREEPLPLEVTMRMMNIPYNNFKTQTCKNYEKEGKCKFGDKCSYAHGNTDLRNPYENILLQGGSSPRTTPIAQQNPQGQISNQIPLQTPQQIAVQPPIQQVISQSFNGFKLQPSHSLPKINHQENPNMYPTNQTPNLQNFGPQFSQRQMQQYTRRVSENNLYLQSSQGLGRPQILYNHMGMMQTTNPQNIYHNQQQYLPMHQAQQIQNNYYQDAQPQSFSPPKQQYLLNQNFVDDFSPLEPLRNKSLSYDNSLSWSGFPSSAGTNNSNGFNYMLINPSLYDTNEERAEQQAAVNLSFQCQ